VDQKPQPEFVIRTRKNAIFDEQLNNPKASDSILFIILGWTFTIVALAVVLMLIGACLFFAPIVGLVVLALFLCMFVFVAVGMLGYYLLSNLCNLVIRAKPKKKPEQQVN